MQLVKCAACGTDVSPAARSCPRCGHPLARTGEGLGQPVRLIVLVSILGVMFCITLVWAVASHMRQTPVIESTAAAVVAPPVPPPPRQLTLQERMERMQFPAAFDAAKGSMRDSEDRDDPGMAVFAVWAAGHLRWSDVAVTTDETTNALALKDSDEARGKRLCASGTIAQITVDKSVAPHKLAIGQLVLPSFGVYRFAAVRSSGTLAKDSWARICGVVTGLYSYTNAMNGTTHAVSIVGMFDLPENRP